MRRPPVPEDARACLEVWSTPDRVDHHLFVAPGEDAAEVAAMLVSGVSDALEGRRQYRLDEPVWLAQFVLRGDRVGCGYGALGAEGPLLRHSLRELAAHAATLLDAELVRVKLGMRLDIVDAIVRALDRWDVVSAVVAASANREEAMRRLAGEPFRFSEHQANHVLDLRVGQRLQDSRAALRDELDQLRAALDALRQPVLDDE
ncbi:MAG: topoisomerase (ATP-hydrolyzing) [Acidimicrobiales bacterium]|nr:topoisomerase (ATP-hydrolyzing) [Acidimicrobiales bacterium]